MAYTYGLSAMASVLTTGFVGTGSFPVRVFDVITVSTAALCTLYNISASTDTYLVNNKLLIINKKLPRFTSNAGLLFNKRCFVECLASGSTCFVNYIEER
jgi:hypothetical protein